MSANLISWSTKENAQLQELGIEFVVAWGGIEPPTRGFSILGVFLMALKK